MDSLPLLDPQRFRKNMYLWSAFLTRRMLTIYFQTTFQGTFLWVSSIISGQMTFHCRERQKFLLCHGDLIENRSWHGCVLQEWAWTSTSVVLSHCPKASWEKCVTAKHYEGSRDSRDYQSTFLCWVRNLSGSFHGYFSPPLVPYKSFPCTFLWRFLHGLHESCLLKGNLEEGS